MENWTYPKQYDVLVIGGGHAGVEAALASARLGAATALLTQNLDTLGQMSCNPAIGGLGKGHMVREIDALGGIMGINTDATGIQFRLLNRGKGPSVRAPRAQCDKKAYQFRIKQILEATPNLDLHQGGAQDFIVEDNQITGLTTLLGVTYKTRSVIVSTGTFMRGLMHVGHQNQKGGRMGDSGSGLSGALAELGFEVKRFKTGTPCRLNSRSIDLSKCDVQPGESPAPPMSFARHTIERAPDDVHTLNNWGDPMFHVEQIPCYLTYTTRKTHEIITDNIHRSPMYSGKIEGTGPRYCPSIEDKVVRFADKDRHQVFLEPEGRHTNELYVNGLSTSLPIEIQYDYIRSIPGLEQAEIIRPGYAVEYDYCPPTQLHHTLETRLIKGLYFAGQINGTSGYEEAAGQGLVAGANAALKTKGAEPFVMDRSESYIGVMIDDLVTKGCTEPYRMFTSRAENRIVLRQDNADLRLYERATTSGLLSKDRAINTEERKTQLEKLHTFVANTTHEGVRLTKWFLRPENSTTNLPSEFRSEFPTDIWEMGESDLKYAGYLRRHNDQLRKTEKMRSHTLSDQIDYSQINGLKKEAQQVLNRHHPKTLDQASSLPGVTPADIAVISVWMTKR